LIMLFVVMEKNDQIFTLPISDLWIIEFEFLSNDGDRYAAKTQKQSKRERTFKGAIAKTQRVA
jgi:hypothetical protein